MMCLYFLENSSAPEASSAKKSKSGSSGEEEEKETYILTVSMGPANLQLDVIAMLPK